MFTYKEALSNMMKALTTLLITALLLVPMSMAFQIEEDKEETSLNNNMDHWTVSDTHDNKEDTKPWWERSLLDSNGNQVSDILEEKADLPVGDHVNVDITVSFSRDLRADDIMELSSRGFQIAAPVELIDAVALRSVPSYRIYEILQMEDVIFIEPQGLPILYSDIANPTIRAKQSDMYSPRTAWDMGYSGEGVSIAVIDTGIDDEHPSLDGKFLGGVDMTKPDNLGVLFPQDGSYNPDDIQGHGSTCSGIATGTGNPEGMYQGPAKDARLVDVRIGSKIGYAPGEFWIGALSDPHLKDGTLRGIEWSTEMRDASWPNGGEEYRGIDIFSISWGIDIGSSSDGSDQYSRLLDAAVDAGVIVVNAAGNDGPDNEGFHGLSASSKAIVIGATDDKNTMEHGDDEIAFYSSLGPRADDGDDNPFDELKPDVSAPGTNIMNLQPDTTRLTGDASSNGYGNRGSGTSYATPLVAGVIALMLEANPKLEGENDIVKEILKYTAERKNPPTYPELDPFWETDFGYGVVDAYNAVRLSKTIDDTNSFVPELQAHITNISGMTNVTPYGEYNLSSSFTMEGMGWSRGGDFDRTEYRIDGGEWRPVDEQSSDNFNPWKVDISGLDIGPHRISVRTISSEGSSLHSFMDVNVVEKSPGDMVGRDGISIAWIVLGIIALTGVAVFIYLKKRHS